jgi:carboxymethylenebutenolidase
MAIVGEWIRYGEGSGYFAKPGRGAGPLPGVLVIQEVGGVNEQIIDVTRRIAGAGYAALAPDLFAQNGVRPPALIPERISEAFAFAGKLPPGTMFDPQKRAAALAELPEAERLRVSDTFGQVFAFVAPGRLESLAPLVSAAFRHLRAERPETRGQRLGCVGFCMGGGLSALLACEEPELSAAAVFYGNTPAPEKIAKITCPVMGFYGGNDQRVNAGIPAFAEGMRAAGKSFESHVYSGANHAFFNEEGPYDAAASRDAFARLLAFFNANLSP